MSKFKLGGIPHHAYQLFYDLRDRVCESNGEQWSRALQALLDTEKPVQAARLLKKHLPKPKPKKKKVNKNETLVPVGYRDWWDIPG